MRLLRALLFAYIGLLCVYVALEIRQMVETAVTQKEPGK